MSSSHHTSGQLKATSLIPGDIIRVRLMSGQEITGKFDIHPLADECVYNQHGVPLSIENAEILELVTPRPGFKRPQPPSHE